MNNYYATINPQLDIRLQSSSGGVFYSLAEQIIKQNGIVFGAIWGNNFKTVNITYTNNLEGIKPMMTSKYVLSNIGNSYKDCKKFLDEGKLVLYTALPCQIYGLKNYLNKDYDSLICVDVCCHGTLPVQAWLDYLETIQKPHNPIISINMRAKDKGWGGLGMKVVYQDGSYIYEKADTNPYFKAFLCDKYLRASCYNCKFKNDLSKADLIIGDYWNIGQVHPQLADNKGTSVVITKTDKGDRLLKQCNLKLLNTNPQFALNSSGGMKNIISTQPEKYDKNKVFPKLPSIVLCSVAKQENKYIREWVEHYKTLGFDNIILYDNNDVDGERFESVINDYITSGFIILKDARGRQEAQIPCFNECYQTDAKKYDYIFFCDTDEFLEIDNLNIKQFINQDKFKRYNAIAINWQNIDDNNIVTVRDNNYSVKRFSRLCENQVGNFAALCRCCKKILKTKLDIIINSPHAVSIPGENQTGQSDFYKHQLEHKIMVAIKCCNVLGEPCEVSWKNDRWTWKEARLKHYRFKTLEEFITNKLPKGYATAWMKKAGTTFLKLENFFKYNRITNDKLLYLKQHENLLGEEDKYWLSKQYVEEPKQILKPHKLRVAINTLPPYNNHGGILQAYALQTVVEQLGYEATVVARTKEDMFPFIDKYIHRRPERIWNCAQNDYDVIITGSDQIFRREWAADAGWKESSLAWTYQWPNLKRIAYAMSMGIPEWHYTNDETKLLTACFNKFTGVGVRENDLAKMLKDRGVNNVEVNPDPTLLLSKEHYSELCKNIPVRDNKCFIYLLGFNGQKQDNVKSDPRRIKLISEMKSKFGLDNIEVKRESTEEWLAAFRDAKYIITDSYHGVLFSLIFNKPFICVANETRGNSRFDTIKENYGFRDHFVNSIEDINLDIFNKPFDSTPVITEQYNKGRNYLSKQLNIKVEDKSGSAGNTYMSFLATDNYLKYILTLNKSLKSTNTKYPLTVLCTKNISKKTLSILSSNHINYIQDLGDIRIDKFRQARAHIYPKFGIALEKLRIFALTQFNKCVFLDSDLEIVKNIDDLFDKPEWSAVKDDCNNYWRKNDNYYTLGDTLFNSGMFVFKPSMDYYEKIMNTLPTLSMNIPWHDQIILAYMNQDWMKKTELHLPYEYNLLYIPYPSTHSHNQVSEDQVKVRHFCMKGQYVIDATARLKQMSEHYKQLVAETEQEIRKFIPKQKKCIGIVSYLPDNPSIREQRKVTLTYLFKQIKTYFSNLPIIVISQNWKDYKIPNNLNLNVTKYDYPALGILKARKTLREKFLESEYDYFIMLDDDCLIKSRTAAAHVEFLDDIDMHPEGFAFVNAPGSAIGLPYKPACLNLCCISRHILEQIGYADIDPQKEEGFEDGIFAWMCHCKFPELEYKVTPNLTFGYLNVDSTWNQTHKQNYDIMRENTKKIIDFISQHKEYPLIVSQNVNRDRPMEKIITKEKVVYKDRTVEKPTTIYKDKVIYKNKIIEKPTQIIKTVRDTTLENKLTLQNKELSKKLTEAQNQLNKLKSINETKIKETVYPLDPSSPIPMGEYLGDNDD